MALPIGPGGASSNPNNISNQSSTAAGGAAGAPLASAAGRPPLLSSTSRESRTGHEDFLIRTAGPPTSMLTREEWTLPIPPEILFELRENAGYPLPPRLRQAIEDDLNTEDNKISAMHAVYLNNQVPIVFSDTNPKTYCNRLNEAGKRELENVVSSYNSDYPMFTEMRAYQKQDKDRSLVKAIKDRFIAEQPQSEIEPSKLIQKIIKNPLSVQENDRWRYEYDTLTKTTRQALEEKLANASDVVDIVQKIDEQLEDSDKQCSWQYNKIKVHREFEASKIYLRGAS